MKTIRERATEYAESEDLVQGTDGFEYCLRDYIKGATEQKVIEIEKACNIFCHIGCPHKTDSYDCLKDKCDAWKRFRRMMEE